MKTNKTLAVIAVAVVTVVGLCSFASYSDSSVDDCVENHTHVSAQGAHCRYTVGCGCRGFAPSGPEHYKMYICRHCGHHKSYHK